MLLRMVQGRQDGKLMILAEFLRMINPPPFDFDMMPFRKCDGKLFPFGFIPVLRALKKNDCLNLLLIAVHPDLQGTGVNAAVIEGVVRGAARRGVHYGETGPQLEKNLNVLEQWKMFPSRQHRRRRCFIKRLDDRSKATNDLQK